MFTFAHYLPYRLWIRRYTVLPYSLRSKVDLEINYDIYVVDGRKIRVYGLKTVSFDFGSGKTFTWNVIVAEVSTPIIGADFLENSHLLPDLKQKLLLDGQTLTSVPCITKPTNQFSIHLVTGEQRQHNNRVADILSKFPDLTKPPKYRENPHDTMHYIETTGNPVHQRP